MWIFSVASTLWWIGVFALCRGEGPSFAAKFAFAVTANQRRVCFRIDKRDLALQKLSRNLGDRKRKGVPTERRR
jgi:hypothetical protein